MTSHWMRQVAPSPSQAMDLAIPWRRAVTAASSCWASGLAASEMRGAPEAPLARPITQSLVLVSPSTVICADEPSHDKGLSGTIMQGHHGVTKALVEAAGAMPMCSMLLLLLPRGYE